jgi:uncharacterized protein (DUF433 family)
MKKLLTATTVAVALVLAPAAAGVAGAADTSAGSTPKATADGHRPLRRAARAAGVVADSIGISRQDLVAALRSGKSIADVAKDHNVDPKAVVDAIVHAADQKIDQAVSNGRLDSDRAATLKNKVETGATKLVDATKEQRVKARHHRHLRRAVRRGAVAVVAKTIGVDATTVVQTRKDGHSIADLARDHNVEPQKVIDALVAAGTKKVDSLVSNGKLDSDKAATIKQHLPERADKIVNTTGHAPAASAG